MQVTTNKQCRAPQKFSTFPGLYNWRRSVIHHCPTPGTFHTLDQLMVQRFYTKLWRVRRHQYIREISSCPSFQHEHTSLFLAWTVQLVMYPMSTVAQQNRKRSLSCGYFVKSGLLSAVLWGRESSDMVGGECFVFFSGCVWWKISYLHWISHSRHKS